jgi:tetratricopeptide (TPR) repeat protein
MAPETLEAVAGRRTVADPRADVYALGLLLYELLTGEFPFPDRTGRLSEVLPDLRADRLMAPPDPAPLRPDVTPAVAAIVKKCLAPDPAGRYPSAAELREDLQRQLENEPLRHAPDRSIRERTRKWARRHPRLSSAATVTAVAAALLLGTAAGGWFWYDQAARLEGQRLAAAVGSELELVRPLAGHGRVTADTPTAQLREARDRCRTALEPLAVLADSDWKDGRYARRLSGDGRDRLCADVGQVLHLWAGAAAALGERSIDPAERAALLAEALAASDRARAAFGDRCPAVVLERRNRLREATGLEPDGTTGCPWDQVSGVAPHTAEYVSAVVELDRGDVSTAAEKLGRFVRDGRPGVSAWTALGSAQLRLGKWDDAVLSLTAAAALAPDSPWAYFARGVVYLEAGRCADAERDFTRVLELNPDVPEARLNRAIALHRLKDHSGAVRDLDELERAGGEDEFPRLYFVREVAKQGLGDAAGADADRRAGLLCEPRDPTGWVARGEARLRQSPPDSQGALADFETAIALDPIYPKAWQNKAHVLSEHLNKPADAVLALDRAIELHPDYVLARAGRAVLHARIGNSAAARADAGEALARDRSALTCYQAACAYLLTARTEGDRRKGLDLLREAICNDHKGEWVKHMPADPDLSAVRKSQEFKDLMTAAGVLHPTAKTTRP